MIDERQPKQFTRTELQSEYIDENVRTEYLKGIEHAENFINENLRQAIESEGLNFDLKLINELKQRPDAINKIIEKHKTDYLNSQKFLPVKERTRIISNYDEVSARLSNINNTLFGLTQKYNYELEQVKDKQIKFNKIAVDNHVLTLGVRKLDETEIKYIKLLETAAELLIEAYNLETREGYVPYSLGLIVPTGGSGYVYQGLSIDLSNNANIVKKLTKRSTFKTYARTLEDEAKS